MTSETRNSTFLYRRALFRDMDFYRIDNIGRSETGFLIDATVFAGHRIYEGHFPGQPVVPGVCTLTVIRESLSAALGRKTGFIAIKECKFLSALIPVTDLHLTLDVTLGAENQIKCSVVHEDRTVLKLNATIGDM